MQIIMEISEKKNLQSPNTKFAHNQQTIKQVSQVKTCKIRITNIDKPVTETVGG